jgi:hypothetical protein
MWKGGEHMKLHKELREQAYNRIIEEIENEINQKEREYEELEIKVQKKGILNSCAFYLNIEEDVEGFQKLKNEVNPEQERIKKEILMLNNKLEVLKQHKTNLIGY